VRIISRHEKQELYKKYVVKSVDPNTKEEVKYKDIFEAANTIKKTRPVKASRGALRCGIFKSSNPHAHRGKYLGLWWVTIGENRLMDNGKWKTVIY